MGKLAVFIVLLTSHSLVYSAAPKIKVKIGNSLDSVTVKGLDLVKHLPTLNKTKTYLGRKSVRFNCVPKKVAKVDLRSPVLLASLSSNTGIIKWEDTQYRGDLKIVTNSDNKSCDLINEISMEDYIATLLSKEMNAKWPIEALKAQAVAARTYAVHKMKTNSKSEFHLENSERFQVNGSLNDETPKTARAADDTEGLVLISKSTKKMTPTFFHAKCGGRTLTPEKVWANKVPGYKEVDCPFCHKYGVKDWKKPIEKKSFRSAVDQILTKYYGENLEKNSDHYMMVPDRLESRYLTLYRNGDRKKIKKAELRKVLGRKRLPSNNFSIKVVKGNLVFDGAGYGHGVGLCQLGALELAKRGYTYKQILAYYFPGHEIKKIY
jgi:stage II sporulation protein D